MEVTQIADLWQLIAAVIALPAFIAWFKNFVPSRYHALLAPIIGAITNVFYGLANGMDFWTSLLQGLGLGWAGSGARDVLVKTVKNR
jgi:hypothetical protein